MRRGLFSALIVAALAVTAGVVFGYRYDLNDDVLIRDILSGAYSGQPEARDIQQLYPIGLLIGALYRIPGTAGTDWYGIFLLVCQYECLAAALSVIIERLRGKRTDGKGRALAYVSAVALALAIITALLPHLAFVQYSMTTAILVATAALLMISHQEAAPPRSHFIAPVILIVTAYCLRSEMTLLLLPLVAVALFIRVMEGRQLSRGGFDRVYLGGYIAPALCLVVAMLLSYLCNSIAYSEPQWREYTAFFDARTRLYDFAAIPEYTASSSFYDSIGLSEEEHGLLVNYNFGLDDAIDADMMQRVAEHAMASAGDLPLILRLLKTIPDYLYRIRNIRYPMNIGTPQTDAPWNIIAIVLYLSWLGSGLYRAFEATSDRTENENRPVWVLRTILSVIWQPILLFVVRSGLIAYLMAVGRDPVRITHGIYLTEQLILVGMLLSGPYAAASGTCEDVQRMPRMIQTLTASALIIIAVAYLPVQCGNMYTEAVERDRFDRAYEELFAAFDDRPDDFFLMDVYTSVAYDHTESVTYSARMLTDRIHHTELMAASSGKGYNRDICGGWYCKSPTQRHKLTAAGLPEEMGEALLLDHVYFVTAADEDVDWLARFYEGQGIQVRVSRSQTIAGVFSLYEVRRAGS